MMHTSMIQRADAKNIAAVAPHLPRDVVEAMARGVRIAEAQFGGAAYHADQAVKRGDALQNILAQRQLEEVLSAEMADKPTLGLFRQFASLIQQGDGSADSFVVPIYDHAGDVAWVANRGSSGVPDVTLAGAEKRKPYHELRNAFSWDLREAQQAARGDFSLLTEARRAAQRYHELTWNRTFFYGEPSLDLDGLVNLPNRINEMSPANGTGSSRYIADKTPDLAAADLFRLCDTIQQDTDGAYSATDVWLSDEVYDHVDTTRMTDTDRTILEYVRSKRGGVTFHRVIELGSSYRTNARNAAVIDSSVGSTFGVAFDRSVVRFMAGLSFTVTSPVQIDPFRYQFGAMSRIGGIKCVKPLGVFTLQEMAA